MKKSKLVALIMLVFGHLPIIGQETLPTSQALVEETTEDFHHRMKWWRDAGFGMFIHWGPYAVPAGVHRGDSIKGISEWIMNHAQIPVVEYEEYARNFNPTEYDPGEWVRLAKEAGMQYIVITSKHHDGFCLWDSKVTQYDAVDFSNAGRDLLAELKTACDEQGMRLGFYHSIMDWHHPDAQAPHFPTYNNKEKVNPRFSKYYDQYLKPQVKELVEKYDPDILWFDGEWIPEYTHEQGVEMYHFIRKLKPDIIINNRVDKGRKGMMGMNDESKSYAGDFGTPEQEILEGTSNWYWESCMTMNDSWGHKSFDHNWKTVKDLIHNLIEIAAKGGNYLLNVGPTDLGVIPQPSVERLKGIGDWMQVNQEIIHNSESLEDFKEDDSIYFIKHGEGSTLYIVATEWPGEVLTVSKQQVNRNAKITMLGYDQPLKWKQETNGSFSILIPVELQDPAKRPCDHAWTFKVNLSD